MPRKSKLKNSLQFSKMGKTSQKSTNVQFYAEEDARMMMLLEKNLTPADGGGDGRGRVDARACCLKTTHLHSLFVADPKP